MVKKDQTVPHKRPQLETSFFREDERRFSGHVVDLGDLARNFTVDLLLDGHVLGSVHASDYVHELAARGVGSGCYGFSLSIAEDILRDASWIEAQISNLGTVVGAPLDLREAKADFAALQRPAQLRWLGGLRFSGWISQGQDNVSIEISVDGESVSKVRASGWTHISEADGPGRAVRAFDVHLPRRFADGCVHRISLILENGELLARAVPFVAFADGLAAAIETMGDLESERPRAELFDRLVPTSIPFAAYERWRERFPIETVAPSQRKIAVVLVGEGDVTRTLESLDRQRHTEWIAATLSPEELQTGFEPTEARSFLESDAKGCDIVVFALSGSELDPGALAHIASAFDRFESAEIVYCDLDMTAKDGFRWPLAFAAFDYERMLEQGYCAHFFAMPRRTAIAGLGRGASSLYRMFNSVFDEGAVDSSVVVHIPAALAIIPDVEISAAVDALFTASAEHLEARGAAASIELGEGANWPAVWIRRIPASGSTTVVVPTRNGAALLRRCIETIRPAVERIDAKILVVDNDSSDPETLGLLDSMEANDIGVLKVEGPFNFSKLNNHAAASVESDYLCLLNNDIEALDDRWLEEMLSRLVEPDTGAVGALLLWPSGIVQHGGVVLGPDFRAEHAFNDRVAADPGYGDLLRVAHECTAVTAACMLTRRSDYLKVGGMDEISLPVAFNDVDYCLKLRQLGKRIVFTPHARLQHLESASRGNDDRADKNARYQRELQALRARWGEVIVNDPYYNPILSLDVPYSALAWPPRDRLARLSLVPPRRDVPPGF
jgi:GT2 family glycosyltransferase